MRFIFLILLLTLTSLSYGQDITTVHFNYKWNVGNSYRGLDRLKNTKVQYAYVEEQSDAIKKSIKSVPTIIIYGKNGKPVHKFEAGLSMEILVRFDSIQKTINKHNEKK
jgi:thiol-disulfide isomerase/thioredoxin